MKITWGFDILPPEGKLFSSTKRGRRMPMVEVRLSLFLPSTCCSDLWKQRITLLMDEMVDEMVDAMNEFPSSPGDSA